MEALHLNSTLPGFNLSAVFSPNQNIEVDQIVSLGAVPHRGDHKLPVQFYLSSVADRYRQLQDHLVEINRSRFPVTKNFSQEPVGPVRPRAPRGPTLPRSPRGPLGPLGPVLPRRPRLQRLLLRDFRLPVLSLFPFLPPSLILPIPPGNGLVSGYGSFFGQGTALVPSRR